MTISPLDNFSSAMRNYSLNNQSAVSSVYQKAVNAPKSTDTKNTVDLINPVQYPNADLVPKTRDTESVQAADAAFNQVAAGFGANITGYGADAAGAMYAMLGSQFDAFA